VMVWIHGGSFVSGAGDLYDARAFAARTGTIVVTVNYRLGAFGYLGFPGLEDSGAFGIADQQAALRWVRRNAHAFGGDPRDVTLFGESAGGYSVCAQLTTPRTLGLFQKAIVQSGPCQFTTPAGEGVSIPKWLPRTQVEQAGAALGCPDVACLRALTVEQVIALAPRFATPAYDTAALPVDPVVALREGRFHHVPVLAGTTRDERTLFIVGEFRQPVDAAGYQAALTRYFGAADAERVAALYPLDGDADARPELAALLTDRMVACTTLEMKGQLRAFGYEFAERNVPMIFDGLPPFPYGAYHGSELAFMFGGAQLTPGQQQLSDYLVDAWGRFARTGDPGWRRSTVQSLAIGAVGPVDYAREHNCGFWSELGLG
ncbi:MAG: carboxylesterase family protein, partial [Umezawaea sp.]